MNRRSASLALVLSLLVAPRVAAGRAGALDPTFGTGGIVATASPSTEDVYFRVLLQPDGGMLASGRSWDLLSLTTPVIVRHLGDGTLDPAFGTGGIVSVPPLPGTEQFGAAVVQPDGKLVVLGLAFSTTPIFAYRTIVARYDAGGTLDPTFGAGGARELGHPDGDFFSADLALQDDGRIVLVGSFDAPGVGVLAVARLTADGDLDPSFGSGGIVTTDVTPGLDQALSLALAPDGKIVAAGSVDSGTPPTFDDDIVVVRYDASGALDPSFGAGGIVRTDLGTPTDVGVDVVHQPDGKLVVGGYTGLPGGIDFTVLRYDAGGSLDPSFGLGGIVSTTVSGADDIAAALLLAPDGRLVMAGNANLTDTGGDFALVRYRADGRLDGSFGRGGIAIASLGPAFDHLSGIVQRPDGTLVGVGFTRNGPGAADAVLARFGTGSCPTVPLPECRTAARTTLQITDRARDTRDRLVWKWVKGGATTLADLGDPLASTAYTLCAYEEPGPAPVLVFESTAPAGGTCGGAPCWQALGSKGFKRTDADGAAEGATLHLLRTGDDGRAKVLVKGEGVQLGPPGLPLSLPLRVQLQASNGECWEATYASPGVLRNDTEQLKVRSD